MHPVRPRVLPTGLVLALVASGLFAGCLSAGDPVAPGPGDTSSGSVLDAFVHEHDHADVSEHAVWSNLTFVHRDGLAPHGTPSGAHALDLHGDLLAIGIGGVTERPERGFMIYDVADPRAPRHLGTFTDPRAKGGDRNLMFSADGKTVFRAAESRDAGEALILAVDVSEPSRPRLVAEVPVPPYGPHTLFAAEIGGVQFVYIVSMGLHVFTYEDGRFSPYARYVGASPEQLLKVPDGLDTASTYAYRTLYGHDLFAWEDPVTGQHLAFVAYAYDGFKIVDLSRPLLPRVLATWVPETPDAPSYVHTVVVRMFGDVRIAAVGAETFENRNRDVPSPLWFLDVTDLANPRLLATWTNPVGAGSQDLLFSVHDMRFDTVCEPPAAAATGDCRVLLWLAHYHAGVWALDVTDPATPVVAGFHLPHEDQGYRPPDNCCVGLRMNGTPATFDVVGRGGIAFAADLWSGLYVLELGEVA